MVAAVAPGMAVALRCSSSMKRAFFSSGYATSGSPIRPVMCSFYPFTVQMHLPSRHGLARLRTAPVEACTPQPFVDARAID